jgi:stage V sporulation protein B
VKIGQIAEESARGSFYLMVGAAVSTIIGAVGVIAIARLLGPANYGLYTLAFVLPGLFAAIADLGVSPALTRYAASLRSEQRYSSLASMMSSGLLFCIITGAVAFLLLFRFSGQLASSVLQRQDIAGLVAFASLTIPFQMVFSLSNDTFVGLDRTEDSARMSVLFGVMKSVLAPVLIVVGFGIAGAVFGLTLAWIFAGIASMWLMLSHRRVLERISPREEGQKGLREDMQRMVRYGMPLYFGGLLGAVLAQYQNLVLAFFTSDSEIGYFNAAANFGAMIAIIAGPVATALFPAFSKLDLQTRKEDLGRMFEFSVRYTALLILPVAVCAGALSKDLIQVVYGTDFASAGILLALYAGTFLATALGSYVIDSFLSGIGETKQAFKVDSIYLAVFAPTALVLVQVWRVPGLIVALVISDFVATGFGLKIANSRYGMRVDLKGSVGALAAALVSGLPILLISYYSQLASLANLMIGATVYVVIYLSLAPVFRAVRRTDLQILSSILGRIRVLRPVTNLVLAYETWVLNAVAGDTRQA